MSPRWWRIIVSGFGLLALVYAGHDLFIPIGCVQQVHWLSPVVYSIHHQIEALVRIAMALAAIFTVWTTHGEDRDRILAGAFIGASLDIYWQWYDPTRLIWLPMALKYAGTSYALMQFIRFAARFSNEELGGVRKALYNLAPWVFVIGAFGFIAQFLKLPSYVYAGGVNCKLNLLASSPTVPLNPISGNMSEFHNTTALFDTYIIGDALAKLAMIVAASIGYFSAPKQSRHRMLWVFLAFCLYAFGTAAHFLLRLYFTDDPEWLNELDAGLSFALPLGLVWAAHQRRFFDVEFYLDRALAATAAGAALLLAYFGVERISGRSLEDWINSAAPWFGNHGVPADTAGPLIGGVLLFGSFFVVHRLYASCEPLVQRYFFPERDKRMRLLRSFKEDVASISDLATLKRRLLHTLDKGADARHAYVYQRAGALGAQWFEAVMWDPDKPQSVPASDPVVAALSRTHKWVQLDDPHATAVDGMLVLPMPVGGTLYGFIVCGPNRSDITYAQDQIGELAAIARETGASLFALQTHASDLSPA